MTQPYDQHCALAHALDVVGERWTLLIVRELLGGPRRYSDIQAGLINAPTNVLSARLKHLVDAGLVRHRHLPRPAERVAVYELTELGRSLNGALVELTRWGMRSMPGPDPNRPFLGHWLVLALQARFVPGAAKGVAESYEFRVVGDEAVHFTVLEGTGSAGLGSTADPAVVIEADAMTFLELSAGTITPQVAEMRGARITGAPAAIARMQRVLPIVPLAPQAALA